MKRRKARELALQFLFQWDVSGGGDLEARLAQFWEWQHPHPEALRFAESLIRGTLDHLREIDGLLAQTSEHWTLDRMATVDRNILRYAAYEILFYEEVPEKVAIDEAIEVAKKYGSAESPAFVNGILDQIVRQGKRKAAAASL
ncbi:MAG: transcription antitermination factor NusB [Nitrospirae bacterium]|nr:transcription antitermination factor NusB [Nitrospirota bacterium]